MFKLLGAGGDLNPRGLARYVLVKAHLYAVEILVETVDGNGEHLLIGENLPKRRSASSAEASPILEGRVGVILDDAFATAKKLEARRIHHREGTGAKLPTPRAVADGHELRPLRDREAHFAATTASPNHPQALSSSDGHAPTTPDGTATASLAYRSPRPLGDMRTDASSDVPDACSKKPAHGFAVGRCFA